MKADIFISSKTLVDIPCPGGQLEAVVLGAKPDCPFSKQNLVAVICHPHPLHGGTMNNKVVTTLARTYRELGIAAVTFNFRGVGRSSGQFAHGIGEVEDLLTVIAWLQQHYSPVQWLLAGFSFGSAVAAQVSYRLENVRHLTLVAPPVERYNYASASCRIDSEPALSELPCPVCVIQGDRDELVDPAGVYRWADQLESVTDILCFEEAGHFFHGNLVAVKERLSEILLARLSLHNASV